MEAATVETVPTAAIAPAKPPRNPPPPKLQPVYGDLPAASQFADLAALDATAAEIAAAAAAPGATPVKLDQLFALNLGELTARARALGATFDAPPNRKQALEAIFKTAFEQKLPITDRGWLDLTDKGHGFIVHEHVNYRLYPENTYVPESLIHRYGLKRGHLIDTWVTAPQANERCAAVTGIRSVMGAPPEDAAKVVAFEELIPYYPLKRILVEATEIHKDISMRAVDLLTPIGFGQRGLIVAPPRTGKTVLLHNIANSVSNNYPEAKLIILLVDERPEEVTDFKRHCKGEVVSSTFDEGPESHVHAAEMVIEKARRLVEKGGHVVILLDSITRLARAYNALASNSGKIMSGGVEATALQKPKRFFGSARNIEGGGSLTILGTALIDTNSRMDEVIFEEFKGTGNMELHLDRGLSDKRIFPAINIDRSGTRKEELIYHPDEMVRVYGLRRAMQGIPPVEAMEMFIQRLKKTRTNAEFLLNLSR
ncbi:transcription termination factor Rho [Opitutaceae bacterium TAV3]|nr:transcription termination factor Rho [Opitutaceae bacterium TAV3]